ncbi:hypothetical protein [Spirosoma areae]
MSIQEMKSKIHQLVDDLQDETILNEVSRILLGESENDILDDLTDEQLEGIEKAREEIRNGNYVTLAEHKQKIEQWLSARR